MDIREPYGALGAAVDAPRLLTEHDLPWLLDLCGRRYSRKQYDFLTATGWYTNIVLKNPMVFLPIRTRDAFLVQSIMTVPWMPRQMQANIVLLCAEPDTAWQVLRLLRMAIQWGKDHNCVLWGITSDTEFDLEPLARRLGAVEIKPRYVLNLKD